MTAPPGRVLLSFLLFPLLAAPQNPRAVFGANGFHFGKVIRGTVVTHDFILRNEGSDALRVGRVIATPPLQVTGRPDQVNAGAAAAIRVTLSTSRLSGPFDGEVVAALNDPLVPEERLSFRGEVYPLLELSPAQPLILYGHRAETRQASIEITSHEPEPLRISSVEHPRERLASEIQVLEDGRRYRLTILLNPGAPAGRHTELLRLATSSRDMPAIELAVDTEIRERVWLSPDALSFGELPISLLRESPDVVRTMAREFTIHHAGSPGFQIQLRSNLPFLDVRCRPAAPDRYTATVRLLAGVVPAGPIHGVVVVETSDPGFPRLTLPISGMILDQ